MGDTPHSLNENFFYNSMLARALLQLLPAKNKPALRMWLYKLHEIEGSPEQMAIRNDYMLFILLMLQSKRIVDPFKSSPPEGELKSLNKILPPHLYEDILAASNQDMIWLEHVGDALDSSELKVQEPLSIPPSQFLENQPLPKDGIICYMAAFSDHDY